MPDASAPHIPCNIPIPDVVRECALSELLSSIHSDDKSYEDVFSVQTCVEEGENANYATPQNPPFSVRRESPPKDDPDPPVKQKEYTASKRTVVAERLCYLSLPAAPGH